MKPRQIYAWIAENLDDFSVSLMCATLGVRREGFYDWHKRSNNGNRDAALISILKQLRKKHPAYGVRGLMDSLPENMRPSYGKLYVVCRDNGLLQCRRRPRCLTKADPEAQKSDDLVQRDFTAQGSNEKVLTDITEVECKDGKLYVCAVLDCFDAAIVGLSMDTNMRTELCVDALQSAVNRFGAAAGMIVHSDRGSQFTSHLFRDTLESLNLRQSMGRTGVCYDNARMESFFATLKKDLVYRLPLSSMTREEVRHKIFVWIETYYNRERRHTSNEYNLPPLCKRELFNGYRQSA